MTLTWLQVVEKADTRYSGQVISRREGVCQYPLLVQPPNETDVLLLFQLPRGGRLRHFSLAQSLELEQSQEMPHYGCDLASEPANKNSALYSIQECAILVPPFGSHKQVGVMETITISSSHGSCAPAHIHVTYSNHRMGTIQSSVLSLIHS